MDGERLLRTNSFFAFGFENFFVRRDLAAHAREFATAEMDFRAIFAGFRARIMSAFSQSAWLRSLSLCHNAKPRLVFRGYFKLDTSLHKW